MTRNVVTIHTYKSRHRDSAIDIKYTNDRRVSLVRHLLNNNNFRLWSVSNKSNYRDIVIAEILLSFVNQYNVPQNIVIMVDTQTWGCVI